MHKNQAFLAYLTFAVLRLVSCGDDSCNRDVLDAGALSDGGNSRDASLDGATQGDAQTGSGELCNEPLDCSRIACPTYHPLTECPAYGQVREGFCGLDNDELRLRVSFDGGGEFIEYWDLYSGKLVGIDRGSDLAEFCDDTSARIVQGDLKRIEACEASRSAQKIICSGEPDDAGIADAN